MDLEREIQKRLRAQQEEARRTEEQRQLAERNRIADEQAKEVSKNYTNEQEALRLERRLRELNVEEKLKEFRRVVWGGKGRIVYRTTPSDSITPRASISLEYDYQTSSRVTITPHIGYYTHPPLFNNSGEYKTVQEGRYKNVPTKATLALNVSLEREENYIYGVLHAGADRMHYWISASDWMGDNSSSGFFSPETFDEHLIELAIEYRDPNNRRKYPTPDYAEEVGKNAIRRDCGFIKRFIGYR